MNLFIRLSIVALLILIFNACSFKTNYPDSWGELEMPKKNKTLLNGIFECSGKMIYKGNNIKNAIVYLPAFLEMKDYKETECDEVHIKQDNANLINIIILKNNKAIEKKVLELNKDYIYNNYILMKKNGLIQAAEIIGYSSSDKYFKLTKNNDLIIERKTSSYGVLFFVIPIIINDNYFVAFKQKSNKFFSFPRFRGNAYESHNNHSNHLFKLSYNVKWAEVDIRYTNRLIHTS